MNEPIRRRRKKSLPSITPDITPTGSLNKRAKQLLDAAKAAASGMENRMFAEMYIYAVEQQIRGNPEFLRFIKQLKQPPVSIEEFLDSKQFMGATDLKLWPEVRKAIIEINSNWWKGGDIAYREALLCGATGTGKTEIMKVTTAYHLHILGCMRKPQRYWGLPEATSIVIPIQAAKPKVTGQVVYAPLRRYIETMPWFIKNMRVNKFLDARMYFDEQNVLVIQGGTDADAGLGDAIPAAIVDEVNFMNVVQKSKRAEVGTGRAGTYDQAQNVYDTLSRRKKGRFTSRGPTVGIICVASSTRYVGDFTDRRKQQVKDNNTKTTYVYDKAQYEVVPQERFCGKKFRLLVSTEAAQDIRILEDDEKVYGSVIEIPIEYKEEFEKDAPGALRDIVGKSANAINPFFRQQHKIIEAIRLGEQAGIESFLNKDNVVLAFDQGLPVPIRGHFCHNPSKPRYVHIDLSNTGDRCGICMVRFDGLQWVARQTGETEPLPIVTVEMAVSVEPDHSNEIEIAEIRSWVASLRTVYGYPIKAVTYDGWNCISEGSEIWTSRGLIKAKDVRKGDIVQTRSGPQPVQRIWKYGESRTLKVTTQHGHYLEMTEAHKIEALSHWSWENGSRVPNWIWVRADNLEEGQVVRIWDQLTEVDVDGYAPLIRVSRAPNNKYYKDTPWLTEEVAQAIGLLHGDGNFGNNYFAITCASHETVEAQRILMTAFEFGSAFTWRQKEQSDGFTAQVTNTSFMRFLDINGLSTKYVVPYLIKESPLKVQAAFISGLLAADGYVKDRDGQVSIETVSRDYADYLMRVLPMFGLGCNLTIRKERECSLPQGSTSIVNSFIVSMRGSRQEFINRIGIAYVCKEEKIRQHIEVAGRYIYSKVSSIEQSRATVVDFQIKHDHSYVVNGFVSHNSMESRQAWKRAGMVTGAVSVDRSTAPYKQLREAFNDGRIMMYNQPVLVDELFSLEYDETKGKDGKIDHPVNGGKDIADALCGAYYTLLTRADSWQMVGESDRYDGGERFDAERR